jgi:hypothetical protein
LLTGRRALDETTLPDASRRLDSGRATSCFAQPFDSAFDQIMFLVCSEHYQNASNGSTLLAARSGPIAQPGHDRHRLGRPAQLKVDQPQAPAWRKPGIACPRLLQTDVIRPDIWIEQPSGGIKMRYVRSLPQKQFLKLTQRSSQFCSLVP